MLVFFNPDYVYKELLDALNEGVSKVWRDEFLYLTTDKITEKSLVPGKTYELRKRDDSKVVIYLMNWNDRFVYDVYGRSYEIAQYDIREVII